MCCKYRTSPQTFDYQYWKKYKLLEALNIANYFDIILWACDYLMLNSSKQKIVYIINVFYKCIFTIFNILILIFA